MNGADDFKNITIMSEGGIQTKYYLHKGIADTVKKLITSGGTIIARQEAEGISFISAKQAFNVFVPYSNIVCITREVLYT